MSKQAPKQYFSTAFRIARRRVQINDAHMCDQLMSGPSGFEMSWAFPAAHGLFHREPSLAGAVQETNVWQKGCNNNNKEGVSNA